MNFWISVLILSTQSVAPMEQHYAETVYETGFGAESDTNYDTWPDRWTRRRGRGFPQYVKIGIADDSQQDAAGSTNGSSRYLRIELDGGGATAYGPPIEISPLFSYIFTGDVKTEQLVHNVAFFTVTFFDSDRQQKEVHSSVKFREAKTWTSVQIGPLTPNNPDTRFAVIGLHLVPTERSDLRGAAMFDNLRLARLPRMSLSVSENHNLFSDPRAVKVSCTVSGIQQPNLTLLLELLDVAGQPIASDQKRLTIQKTVRPDTERSDQTGFARSVAWRPPVPGHGFYRVRASLRSGSDLALRRSVSLAVMEQAAGAREGEFGWSLPRGEDPLSTDQLVSFLVQAGVCWVKFPIWYSPSDEKTAQRLADFADRLSAQDIELVGMFDKPPKEVRDTFGNKEHLTVAEVFLEPEMWHPLIDPLMVRLSLKIRWWQFGADDDDSFIDFNGFEEKIHEIRSHLRQFGQKMRLGVAWRWMHEIPMPANPPWDFLAMTESPAFTYAELTRYAGRPPEAGARYFMTLTPLPKDVYETPTRARDLVLRMVAAKVAGAEAIFLADPFDAERGLMNPDGTPTELFLPWCVTARAIGGAHYLGTMQLPNNSHNRLFSLDGKAVMVVWSDAPTTEEIYLGEDVKQIDLWGREHRETTAARQSGQKQRIAVSGVPTLVTGLNLSLAQWRLRFGFEPGKLASVFGRHQAAQFRFRNSFSQGVGGTMRLHVPEVWDVRNRQLRFKLASGEELRQEFSVLLRTDASSGPQRVRVDFDLTANHRFQFSIYRDIQVGLGDILLELSTWLDDDGNLIVEQQLINTTPDRLNFNCMLFAPGRRRLRQPVFDIGPGRITHTFVLSDGRSLLGKTLWLRVEQLGGKRLLNYHVVAEP